MNAMNNTLRDSLNKLKWLKFIPHIMLLRVVLSNLPQGAVCLPTKSMRRDYTGDEECYNFLKADAHILAAMSCSSLPTALA